MGQSTVNPPQQVVLNPVVSGNAQNSLSWTAPSSAKPIQGYRVYRSLVQGQPGPSPPHITTAALSCVDTGLTNGTPYYYQVSCFSSGGEGLRSAERAGTPTAPAATAGEMFVTAAELAQLPTSGPSWDFLRNRESALFSAVYQNNQYYAVPNLQFQFSVVQTNALCCALVYKKIGATSGLAAGQNRLTKLQSLLAAIQGTEMNGGGQPLNVWRQLGAWFTVADLIGYNTTAWQAWCDSMYTKTVNGDARDEWKTLKGCAADCGANWGAYARHALVALAIHRNNQVELNLVVKQIKRWLGDTAAITNTLTPTADYSANGVGATWNYPQPATYPASRGVIQAGDVTVGGTDGRAGVNIEDVVRGLTGNESPSYSDNKPWVSETNPTQSWNGQTAAVSYQQESADAMWAAFVLLHHAGYTDVWEWSSRALLRNLKWIDTKGHGFSSMFAIYRSIPYLANRRYGTSFPVVLEANLGSNDNIGRAATAYSWLTQSALWCMP